WWDVASGKKLGEYEEHTARVWDIVFAADGKSLFSLAGGGDCTLRRIDLASRKGKILETFPAGVRSLARHGQTLAVGTFEGHVGLWDTETEKEKVPIKVGGMVAERMAFDPKGHALAEGGWGARGDGGRPSHLAIYDLSGKRKFKLDAHEYTLVTGVAYSP